MDSREGRSRLAPVESALHAALAPYGWFIDIAHSDSIAALRKVDGPLGGPLASTRVDLSHLTGPVRPWTVSLATELRGTVLDDGGLAHGIRYPSTHGVEHECFAYWMRAVDDGQVISSEPMGEIARTVIDAAQRNRPFKKAADQLGLTCY